MPTNYPTPADLLHYLEMAGLTVSDAQRRFLDSTVNAAKAEFESACDRTLLAGAAAERRFDPPTAYRDGRALLFVPDIASGGSAPVVLYYPTDGTSETLTEGTGYDLLPYDAPGKGQPYTQIALYGRNWLSPLGTNQRRSIRITAQWGYSTTVPQQAWDAILARAAWRLYPAGRLNTTGGLLGWKDGDRSVDYGVQVSKDLLDGWDAVFQQAVSNLRRWTL